MGASFFEPGERRAERVQDLFAVVAPRYDLINDLQSFGLHRFWKSRLLRVAQVRPGDRVLDVCCGTGDVALRFAKAGCGVVGLDFSQPMLRQAEARARAAGLSVSFLQGDALQLPFSDSTFEVVTISYGLRNLASVDGGLAEMHRVARKHGRVLVLDFGKPPNPLLRALYFAYLRHWVPVFGRLVCGDAAPYAYILESLRQYPAQEGVAAAMKKLGCHEVRISNLLGGIMSINSGQKAS